VVADFIDRAMGDDYIFIGKDKTVNCDNVFVRSSGPFTEMLGLSVVVVIATDDAVLIGHKDKT
jgi:mannose-1-phosphate guanylyltransferase